MPVDWRRFGRGEDGFPSLGEIPMVPAQVPGSVQGALRRAGTLPDWNYGLHARDGEWVENRHWIYEVAIPPEWLSEGHQVRLTCLGLDYSGWILVNRKEIATFKGTFVPHRFDLTPFLTSKHNRLQIVFDFPPRYMGQCDYTSRIADWKARFYYTWDWTPRLVQTGIWDKILLEVSDGNELSDIQCRTDAHQGKGELFVRGRASGASVVRLALARDGHVIRSEDVLPDVLSAGIHWRSLPVELWHPNGQGSRPLYTLRVELQDRSGVVHDSLTRRLGFKHVEWRPCEGAPAGADPWICVVNDRPVFLQGVNWTPIRPHFADVTDDEYRQRLTLYRDLGCNVLRVWGGAVLERECFYDLCDELGLMVWQEFPVCSSGFDNWPPEEQTRINEIARIATSYIRRRQHHAALLLWCGGNELQGDLEGNKHGVGKPIDSSHPMMRRVKEIVDREDPGRRFLPTSSSGPRFTASEQDYGKGLHWDVHGPWSPPGDREEDWVSYWEHDDALFRSETGAPGASPVDIIKEYRGDLPETPGTMDNPLWRRTSWWIEWPRFVSEQGREPRDIEEYAAWSQARQAKALSIAVRACQRRFPRMGGIILWMGHDAFPCMTNTSVVDFHGRPKPAALAVGEAFRRKPEQ